MSVDVDALIALTIEKEIPLEKMISAIENAVTEAYVALEDAKPQGRAVLNRVSGEILIHVPQFDDEGIYTETITHMPEGFEQVIQSITRKEIKQRMRAAKDADVVEEFSASVGDVLSGVIQQGRDATLVYVDLGRVEGKIPPNEQVPTESYIHGQRIKCFVVDVKQGLKGPEVTLSRTHPLLVKSLFTLEVPELKDRIVEIVGVSQSWFGAASKTYPRQTQVDRSGRKSEVTKLNDAPALKVGVRPKDATYYIVDGEYFVATYARILIRKKASE